MATVDMPQPLATITGNTREHMIKQRNAVLKLFGNRDVDVGEIREARNYFILGYIFGILMAQISLVKALRENPPPDYMTFIALKLICGGLYGDKFSQTMCNAIALHCQNRQSFWWRITNRGIHKLFKAGEDFAAFTVIKSGLKKATAIEHVVLFQLEGKLQEYYEYVLSSNATDNEIARTYG